MKSTKLYLMAVLLITGAMNLNAQVELDLELAHEISKKCVSFVQVKQECQADGTVDLTFMISNNTKCYAKGVSITPIGGFGQSYPVSIPGQSVSIFPFSYQGAVPGKSLCFEVVLHGSDRRACCKQTVCIEIEECCEMEASHEDTGGCDPENRWARVVVSGGTSPYSGPPNSFQAAVPGNFIVNGLSVGFHTLVFTDSEGCEVEITIYVPAGDCSNLIYNLDQNSTNPGIITSQVSATVGISIVGYCIPDRVEVYVNGSQVVQLEAGTGGCASPLDMGASDTFCVEPCDEVEFVITGNICPNQHSCEDQNTAYEVYTWNCTLKGGGGDGGGSRYADDFSQWRGIDKEVELNKNARQLKALSSIELFPNPVKDQLNINLASTGIGFQNARIINSAGQTVQYIQLSNQEQTQIDASFLKNGVYFLEMTDEDGQQHTRKFIKMN